VRGGGLGSLVANLTPAQTSPFGIVTPWNAFASMLTLGLGIVSWPDIWQRVYAAKSSKVFQKSFGAYIFANLFLTAAVMFLGFASIKLMAGYEGGANGLQTAMIMKYLPKVLGAILLAALMAVIMGSADSVLLISAVIVSKDLIEPLMKRDKDDAFLMKMRKIVTGIVGLATLIVLMFSTDMFALWVMSADITGATLAVPILIGFVWKKPSESATIASIVFGFAGWLLWTIVPGFLGIAVSAILPGAVLSLVAYVVTAFVAPSKKI
jgi:Na+/proline symporter